MLYDGEDGIVIRRDDKATSVIIMLGESITHIVLPNEHVHLLIKGLTDIDKSPPPSEPEGR